MIFTENDLKELLLNKTFDEQVDLIIKFIDSNTFVGVDKNYNICFGILMNSHHESLPDNHYITSKIEFIFNKKLLCRINDTDKIINTSIFKFIENEKTFSQILFIELCINFITNYSDYNIDQMLFLFDTLIDIFSKGKKYTESQLQGFFAEMYFIIYMIDKYGIDLSKYRQSSEMMKFDFSLTEKNKIEIKSTLKTHRIHHFIHEQLCARNKVIKIVSFMLRKDDKGKSLIEILLNAKNKVSSFSLISKINKIMQNIYNLDMNDYKYDEDYLIENMSFYVADDIPKAKIIHESVINAQYDCDLTNVQKISEVDFVDWIKESINFNR